MEAKIPHLLITIQENDIIEGAKKVLEEIRPNWPTKEIQFKLLTDGITNKLIACCPENRDIAETVLVRIYGNKTDLLIDRKAETRNILLLGKVGLAPSLYATFENGLAYEFVPGVTLDYFTVTQKQIYSLIATRMAKLHKVKIQNEAKPFIWQKTQNFLDLVPEIFSDANKNCRFLEIGVSKMQLQAELDFLKMMLSDTPVVVFCHNDLLLGNVVYTKEKNCVTFIDYEYAAFNYQAFDIANHFLEFAGVENVDYSKYPDRNLQLDWLQFYLKEFLGDFTELELEKLYQDVNRFILVSHLFWGIWALIQTEHSYIDFDFLGYAAIRFKEYFEKKKNIFPKER